MTELDDVRAELAELRGRYDREVNRRPRWERDVYTAARRSAEEDRRAWMEIYLAQLLDRTAPWLRELTYKIGNLPDRPKLADVQTLRQVGRTAEHVLNTYREELASRPDYGRKVRAEVDRLRAYVVGRGSALHASLATDADRDVETYGLGACRCVGCELIRGMDDVVIGEG